MRWSEKYTKTDMLYLAKSGSVLSATQIINSLLAITLTVVFAKLLSKETYGAYKFAISIAGIIGAFSLTGMGSVVVRAVSQGYEGSFLSGFKTLLKWNILLFFIGLAGSIYYFINENNTLAIILLIIAVLLPLQKSFFLFDSYLRGRKDFKTSAIYGVISGVISTIALIVTVFLTNNPVIIVLIFFLSSAVIGISLHILVKKTRPVSNTNEDLHTIPYAKHLSVMKFIGNIGNNIDNLLMFHYLGPALLAIYSFALAPPREFGVFNGILQSLALPKFSTRDIKELKSSIPRKALIVFFFSVLLFIFYIIIAPYLYKFIFPRYIDSVLYSQVFAIIILSFPASLFGQTLIAHAKKRELYILNTIIPITRIGLLLVLLPLYGIWGAIASILLTRFTNLFVSIYLFYRLK